eukprot:scaffold3103_cov66-Isochrysis_galbana.AAC.1
MRRRCTTSAWVAVGHGGVGVVSVGGAGRRLRNDERREAHRAPTVWLRQTGNRKQGVRPWPCVCRVVVLYFLPSTHS